MKQLRHAPQFLTLLVALLMLLHSVKTQFSEWNLVWAYILLLSFCITYTLMPVVRRVALRIGAVDQPGGRKTHVESTPLMGGAAIYFGFALVMIFGRDILHFSLE